MTVLNINLPTDQTHWTIEKQQSIHFNWNYDSDRGELLALYDKAKKLQWDSNTRLDWSEELDPDNPLGLPDFMVPIYGSPIWNKMSGKDQATVRHHVQSFQISQFLHGEQGALMCASGLAMQVPGIDAKLYAGTQVVDEARHMEVYSRLLKEKFDVTYPISNNIKAP